LPNTFDDPSTAFNSIISDQQKSLFCRTYYDINIRKVLKAELAAIYKKDVSKPNTVTSSAISTLILSTSTAFLNAIDNNGCNTDPKGHVLTVYQFVVQGAKLIGINNNEPKTK
jgi:hypothetical protein